MALKHIFTGVVIIVVLLLVTAFDECIAAPIEIGPERPNPTITPTITPTMVPAVPTPTPLSRLQLQKVVADKYGMTFDKSKNKWLYNGEYYQTSELNAFIPGFEEFKVMDTYKKDYIDKGEYIDKKTLKVKSIE